jgi:tetratricopeptide (TPR) repeat protein
MNIRLPDISARSRSCWLAVFLIGLTACIIYSNTWHAPFVFDDQHTVQENFQIRNLHHFYTFGIIHTPRPVGLYTFALNYHFGRLHVWGYHIVNTAIHIINGILVFFLSLKIFQKLTQSDQKTLYFMALAASLVFTVHPLQTQAITYISQRYASLAALFYLLSVLCYMNARDIVFSDQSDQKAVWQRIFYLSGSLLCGIMAFLCKQTAATLPISIILMEYVCYEQRWMVWKRRLLWVAPAVLLCGMGYAYSMGAFQNGFRFATLLEDVSHTAREVQHIGRWQYLCTQFSVIVIYIRLLFLPVGQNLDYDYPMKQGFFDGATPYAFLILAAILVAAVWHRKKRPVLFLGVAWFFMTLSVESSIFPIRDALFEHRVYLPMFGFSLIIGWLSGMLFAANRLWGYGVAAAVVVVLASMTVARNDVWGDPVTLWSDVVAKSPSNVRGITNLGFAYQNLNDWNMALAWYNRALQLNPEYLLAENNKGVVLGKVGRVSESIALFKNVLKQDPGNYLALNNLGVALVRRGDIAGGIDDIQKSLQSKPQYLDARLNLATIFANTGKLPDAVDQYQTLIRLEPENVVWYNKLGAVYYVMSKYQDAISQYQQAIRLDAENSETYLNLGNAQLAAGALNEAIASFKKSIALNPKSLEGHINLGVACMRAGNADLAAIQLNDALAINPNSAEAHADLGNVLFMQGKRAEALQHLTMALKLQPGSQDILNNIQKVIGAGMMGAEPQK